MEEFVRHLSRKEGSCVTTDFYVFVSVGYGLPNS